MKRGFSCNIFALQHCKQPFTKVLYLPLIPPSALTELPSMWVKIDIVITCGTTHTKINYCCPVKLKRA